MCHPKPKKVNKKKPMFLLVYHMQKVD
jgi:hypothetical protein